MKIDGYRALIERNFPQLIIQTVQSNTSGWDSFVLVVNDELIFRFPLRENVVECLEREMRLLPLLEKALSTSVPHFTYIGSGNAEYPFPFVGYRKLDGIALEDERIPSTQIMALIPHLSTFLSELHRFLVEEAMHIGMPECKASEWRERYQKRYLDVQQRIFPLLNAELRVKSERLWKNFLEDETLFVFQPVLLHGDLGCEHIFCDPERGRLMGIIDWGDVTIGDPALDFVGLHRSHGREFMERVLEQYQGTIDAAFWSRMDFYLHYQPFSELLYGVYSENEKFIEMGREHLCTMFGQ